MLNQFPTLFALITILTRNFALFASQAPHRLQLKRGDTISSNTSLAAPNNLLACLTFLLVEVVARVALSALHRSPIRSAVQALRKHIATKFAGSRTVEDKIGRVTTRTLHFSLVGLAQRTMADGFSAEKAGFTEVIQVILVLACQASSIGGVTEFAVEVEAGHRLLV